MARPVRPTRSNTLHARRCPRVFRGAFSGARGALRTALILVALLVAAAPLRAADAIRVTLDPTVTPAASSGRLIVSLVDTTDRFVGDRQPIDAPFFESPQPLMSVHVPELRPDEPVELGDDAISWPAPISTISGRYRVQAVFKCNRDERSHLAPGNVFSHTVTVDLDPEHDEVIELRLSELIQPPELPRDPLVAWVEIESPMLTEATGRPVKHRAGVVFPKGYDDIRHPRRIWPTIYVIPGFGGRYSDAVSYLRMVQTPGTDEIAPQAVYVVLDPEAPLGHHGFVDSPANGPRGTALVKELIPYLESRYRLIAAPEARIVTGHSSGGWSSLWLQLQWPDVFGACWASAPDPVSFDAFQLSDLYGDFSLFTDANGHDQPSYRLSVSPRHDKVLMTVREEIGMERVLGPDGDSGEQWDAWAAMFSSIDPKTGLPKRPFDPLTGVIHRRVIEEDWSRFDIARLVNSDWERYGPILRDRVRLACGQRDSFYLNRAVERLRTVVAKHDPGAIRGDDVPLGEMPNAKPVAKPVAKPSAKPDEKPDEKPEENRDVKSVPPVTPEQRDPSAAEREAAPQRPSPAPQPAVPGEHDPGGTGTGTGNGQDNKNEDRDTARARELEARGFVDAGPQGDAFPAELTIGGGPGYIWLVRHATHDTIVAFTTLRWNSEMIEYLRQHLDGTPAP